MKTKLATKAATALLALCASTWMLSAQDADNGGPEGNRPPPPRGQRGPGKPDFRGPGEQGERGPQGPRNDRGPEGPGPQHRPPHPIVAALDANHDGVIDEHEIANASAALAKLDRNGDGVLTPDEFHPLPPPDGERGGRPEGGPGPGPRGGRGPNRQ